MFSDPRLVESQRGNFSGAYPGGFYSFMHIFVGKDIQSSVLVMRVVNSLLFGLIMAALWVLIPKQRQALYFTVLLTYVPFGLFLTASINPSSWALLSAITVFFAFSGALKTDLIRTRVLLYILTILGIVLAISARFDALAYAVTAVFMAWVVAHNWIFTRRTILLVSAIGGVILGGAFFFGIWRLVPWLASFAGDTGHSDGTSPLKIFMNNVLSLPMLISGFSGGTGLGWLDTEMPLLTWMTSATLLWAALFSRIAHASRRQVIASGLTSALLVAVPLAVLQSQLATVGQNVQARYLFPLMLVLASILFYQPERKRVFFTRVQVWLIVAGLFCAQFAAIFFNMSRYISYGKLPISANLNESAANGWWWGFGPSPMVVLFVASLSFAMLLTLAFSFTRAKR